MRNISHLSTVRSALRVGWIKRPLLRIHALAAFVHPAQHRESTGLGGPCRHTARRAERTPLVDSPRGGLIHPTSTPGMGIYTIHQPNDSEGTVQSHRNT